MNKLQEFISFINSKIGSGYVYGGQNAEPLTKEALASMVTRFGRAHYYYSTYSAEKWLGYEYYDCSGLVVYTLRKLGLIPMIADYSAQSIYSVLCTPIKKSELKPGDICFKNTSNGIVHCGVYTGEGRVTHARGTLYGVVNTILFDSFDTFGRLKYFVGDVSQIKIHFEQASRGLTTAINVYELPDERSQSIGKIDAGSNVNIEAVLNGSWYLVKLNKKMGYAKIIETIDNEELKKALQYLSEKAGISQDYWYKQAMNTKWLDVCFIKLAKGFGGLTEDVDNSN